MNPNFHQLATDLLFKSSTEGIHPLLYAFEDLLENKQISSEKALDYAPEHPIGTILTSSSFIANNRELFQTGKLFILRISVGKNHHLEIPLKLNGAAFEILKAHCSYCKTKEGAFDIKIMKNIFFKPEGLFAYDRRVSSSEYTVDFLEQCLNSFEGFLKKTAEKS